MLLRRFYLCRSVRKSQFSCRQSGNGCLLFFLTSENLVRNAEVLRTLAASRVTHSLRDLDLDFKKDLCLIVLVGEGIRFVLVVRTHISQSYRPSLP